MSKRNGSYGIGITCEFCGRRVVKHWNGDQMKVPRFCDRSCSAKWRVTTPAGKAGCKAGGMTTRQRHPELLRQTPERRAASSARMKAQNPMADLEVRARAAAALRGRPFPGKRGGNGTGPTKAEAALLALLPDAVSEFAVAIPKRVKPPGWNGTNLKLDLAFPKVQLGIECDGQTHKTRLGKERDARKELILGRLGWTVLRFWNEEILADPESVTRTIRLRLSSMT